MKQYYKFAAGVIASLGLGIAAATAYAQPGQMGGGMGAHMQGGMQHGGMSGGAAGYGAGPELMTQEERSAMIEKMHNAATPEERQKIIAENRAEMQKRAREKGITQPEHRGPHAGFGPRTGTGPQAPTTN